jgi:hypothetical protein
MNEKPEPTSVDEDEEEIARIREVRHRISEEFGHECEVRFSLGDAGGGKDGEPSRPQPEDSQATLRRKGRASRGLEGG